MDSFEMSKLFALPGVMPTGLEKKFTSKSNLMAMGISNACLPPGTALHVRRTCWFSNSLLRLMVAGD